jgi:hypothetical protein
MSETPSALYRLIEAQLDGTLADFIAERRPHVPWRQLTAELTEKTGVEVSWESVRGWFADRIEIRTEVTVR